MLSIGDLAYVLDDNLQVLVPVHIVRMHEVPETTPTGEEDIHVLCDVEDSAGRTRRLSVFQLIRVPYLSSLLEAPPSPRIDFQD